MDQFVIAGAGLAGAKAAETLRAEGFAGRIVLIGDEPARPYDRPPLSKAHLLGPTEPDSAYLHPWEWYGEQDIDLRTGVAASGIDRATRTLMCSDGTSVSYDRLLIATGSAPRRLEVAGAGLEGVLYLRTLADSAALNERIAPGARVVIIGAGWIGLEVAAACRARGAHATVVELAQLPLQRVLGDQVATVFAQLHRANDVSFHCGSSVREIRGEGRVTSVVLTGDVEVPADLVVAGVGIRPNTGLAESAGLTVDNGIRVDASMRTSDPAIFAAGDVANVDHPLLGMPVRVEHWANALHSGPAAARSMLGQQVTYDRVPYFYTDQYDLGMEYAGYVTPSQYDQVVFRGDPTITDGKTLPFLAFWLSHGRVLAGMNVNIWDVQDQIQALVRAGYRGVSVDPVALANPDIPLTDLLAE
jgi:3-phenylpropionate/trans-cinnamate dioxygenase ferredoxin reductase subunit